MQAPNPLQLRQFQPIFRPVGRLKFKMASYQCRVSHGKECNGHYFSDNNLAKSVGGGGNLNVYDEDSNEERLCF